MNISYFILFRGQKTVITHQVGFIYDFHIGLEPYLKNIYLNISSKRLLAFFFMTPMTGV